MMALHETTSNCLLKGKLLNTDYYLRNFTFHALTMIKEGLVGVDKVKSRGIFLIKFKYQLQ